ncbi:hypothetical protein HKCCSP123_16970 [Rhodobacterales bacterium HKCCSP123]|nr:hypothetical protein [Rhodobacterales bacterium HKCCSP123]
MKNHASHAALLALCAGVLVACSPPEDPCEIIEPAAVDDLGKVDHPEVVVPDWQDCAVIVGPVVVEVPGGGTPGGNGGTPGGNGGTPGGNGGTPGGNGGTPGNGGATGPQGSAAVADNEGSASGAFQGDDQVSGAVAGPGGAGSFAEQGDQSSSSTAPSLPSLPSSPSLPSLPTPP